MSARLPAAIEASALIRLAEANGGFGMVLQKGDPDSGSIIVVIIENQGLGETNGRLFERLPRPDGTRGWSLARVQDTQEKGEFDAYLARRMAQDRDLWVIELAIADGEQFVLNLENPENKPGSMG